MIEVRWRAWREEDEPESELVVPSVSHTHGEMMDGQYLAGLIVWQQASNDQDNPLWNEGVVIVQIVAPEGVAGIYGVEIERRIGTRAHEMCADERERMLAGTLCK